MEIKNKKSIDNLFCSILTLKNTEECYRFFRDACTIKEIEEIAQRFEVAQYLWQGKSYNEINQATGASTATICRVKKSLLYGNDGYKLLLERQSDMEDAKNE